MSNSMNVFGCAVGKNETEFQFIIGVFADCPIDSCLPPAQVFRRNALHPFGEGVYLLLGINPINAIPFVREIQWLVCRDIPNEATCVGQALRFGEVSLT